MGDGSYVLDIVLLAMVAGFIILRLRSVLGRRTGQEPPPRPVPAPPRAKDEDKVVALPDRARRVEAAEAAAAAVDPTHAALTRVKLADPRFETEDFLAGAKAAYELIVTAFAAGDLPALRPLLSDEVYDNFRRAIEQRKADGHKLETTLVGIKRVDVLEADVKGRTAEVTVKFVAELINATRDAAGNMVSGNANAVDEVTDIWTFARDTRASDPNWQLAATSVPA